MQKQNGHEKMKKSSIDSVPSLEKMPECKIDHGLGAVPAMERVSGIRSTRSSYKGSEQEMKEQSMKKMTDKKMAMKKPALKSSGGKVPEQKGKIVANPPVMQQMTFNERKSDDKKGAKLRKTGMELMRYNKKNDKKDIRAKS